MCAPLLDASLSKLNASQSPRRFGTDAREAYRESSRITLLQIFTTVVVVVLINIIVLYSICSSGSGADKYLPNQ